MEASNINFNLLDLLPIVEAAEKLYCSRRTLDNAIRAGQVEAYKPGGRVMVDMDSAKKWFFNNKVSVSPTVDLRKYRSARKRYWDFDDLEIKKLKEAAEILFCSPKTLRDAIDVGKVEA